MIALDTETYLIGPKAIVPKLVCASFCNGHNSRVLSTSDELLPELRHALEGEIVGKNIAYDLAVIMAFYPSLTTSIFKALERGRVHDVGIREKLINLGTHGQIAYGPTGKQANYSLAGLARQRTGLDLSAGKEGDDVWRLRYRELDGLPAPEYPQEAYDYAALDAQATWEVWRHQEDHEDSKLFLVEDIHVRAAFNCMLKTAWGIAVDKERKEKLQAEVDKELGPENLPLLYEGEEPILFQAQPPSPYKNRAKAHTLDCDPKERKKGCDCPLKMRKAQPEKLNKKKGLVPLIEKVCHENGVEIKKTEKGSTSTAADFLEEIAHLDPRLEQYKTRAKLNKLVTSYFPGFEWPPGSGQTADVIHPNYDPLKKTGRISSYGNSKKTKNPLYPAVSIQQADPRVRSIYKPRDGWLFAVCDYSAIDLCSCAQTMHDLFGTSNLLDQINKGIDPHAFLGSVLAYNEDPEFRAEVHGMSEEEGYAAFLKRKETHPDWFKHWRTFAKPVGLGFPGGLGLATMVGVCAGYGIRITKKEAKKLRQIWYSVYPVMRRYLRGWVERQGGVYESPLGMVRAGCNYTELANGRALQTPAAEGMKIGSWKVTRACYDPSFGDVLLGCRPVMEIHDELVVEIPDDEWATERADRISQLMIEGMNVVLPDVKIKADPVLTRRWVKDAKSERKNGRITVWTE